MRARSSGMPVTEAHAALSIPQGATAASHAIVVEGEGEAVFSNTAGALAEPNTDLRIFAKPEVHGHRRMAVALAIGSNADDARTGRTCGRYAARGRALNLLN